ncbi:hypothetical protein Taro_036021 [Colocasia esculenta]|uniref:Uncharacterized protein n=1 Tax=Colocasia esculenta TaxID=4460 RepID=A0A843W5J0_COLES|nr:hypothetical protein [Colocasia esculenta]
MHDEKRGNWREERKSPIRATPWHMMMSIVSCKRSWKKWGSPSSCSTLHGCEMNKLLRWECEEKRGNGIAARLSSDQRKFWQPFGVIMFGSHIFVLVVSTLDQVRSTLDLVSSRSVCLLGHQVDTRSKQVDTRSKQVDTRSSQVDTRSKQVDTRSGQVDTRPSFQQTSLPDWESRSTLDQGRSCKPSFQEEGQGNQRESLERRLLCKAREQIQLKRLRRRRIYGISDAIKAEHRQLRRISIDFHQGSSIEAFTHFCLGSVDTRSSQVDTRPSFQQISLPDWDIRSTLDQSRSTLDQSRSTLDQVRSTLDQNRSTLDQGRSTLDPVSSRPKLQAILSRGRTRELKGIPGEKVAVQGKGADPTEEAQEKKDFWHFKCHQSRAPPIEENLHRFPSRLLN